MTIPIFKKSAACQVEQCDNIYDKIQELLGCLPGSVSILEEQIDAGVQMEYYNYARQSEGKFNPEEVLKNKDALFKPDFTLENKKHMMVQLATIDNIEAYRTLEKYTNDVNDPLKDWATLALQECRLLIESKLLDQSQVLISTGLGGKGLKLRYFTVIVSRALSYSPFQQKIITDELRFAIRKFRGELEEIQFDNELCTILSIIPLQAPVQLLFDELVAECNQYGDFINPDYMITNVKVITNTDVRKMIAAGKNKTRKE